MSAPLQMSTSRYIVVQDPCHDYAVRFIRHIHDKYGYRAICFFTNRREFLRQASAYPLLQSDCVAATFEVQPQQLNSFAGHMRDHYDIAAIIPFNEPAVATATQLAQQLGLSWSQPPVLQRFRDKYSLKQYLRAQDQGLRINATCKVSDADDVIRARSNCAFDRFVLKPNDGFGNRDIGMFDASTDRAQIERYLRGTPGMVLMEEYVGGTEYFINGQIDAVGQVTVIAIFEYQRIAANGRTNIDSETRRLPQTDPLFATLAAYSRQVMRASGLIRSPFHLEVKVDACGPCLIEVAARLPGLCNASLCSELHGAGFDWFDVAAHYYLSDADYGVLPLNWQAYDSSAVRYVHGIASNAERIHQLHGVQQTEALPAFRCWVKEPVVGARLRPTIDCLSMPWSLVITTGTEVQATQAAAQVRQLLAWNDNQSTIARGFSSIMHLAQRGMAMLRLRLLCAFLPLNTKITILSQPTGPSLGIKLARLTSRCVNALVRRYQLARFGKGMVITAAPVAPEFAAVASEAVTWAEEYLAKPHAQLGRKGPICPFVKHTVDIGRYFVSVHGQVDGRSINALRGVVIDEAAAFLQRSPNVGSKGAFGSLVMVFPHIPDERLGILDQIHDELKTPLMERDLMFSPFHKHSSKPSISNPEFKVFRAPFAALVVRHLDVRDIA
ncbi:MAG: acetyl-CoA carboxylase biotin carboxylase subunit family protein, partial [Steroidobacteraceae bacterium]